ncbi:MAG: hypothetical protein JXX14_25755 [Deltaproteobacteria bacterium]|nr:hypothetical protein [Deltaproteobacteria bacterium]
MIWFDPENKGGFDVGTPDWSGASAKAAAEEPISNIVIGQPFATPQPGPQMHSRPKSEPPPPPEPEPPPPPPPEPEPDPRVENNLKLLATSISELARVRKEMTERDLSFCVRLAFAIAEQLTCGTLEAKPEKTIEIVKESLGMFDESDRPVVRLHPDIHAAFEEHELLNLLEEMENVTVKVDPSVSAMGCVVNAGRKTVNAEVFQRLAKLKTLFSLEQGGDI